MSFSPRQVYLWGFYLRKIETGHAGGHAVLCWARIWLCWAHWARLGADLALLGALGWVGRGFGFLCMVYIVHVFFISSWCLCVYFHVNLRCVSWGLSKAKPVIGEWNVVWSNSVFEKVWCEANEMEATGEKRQWRQPTQLKKDSIDNSAVLQLLLDSFNTTPRVGNELRVRNATSRSLILSPKLNRTCVSALNKINNFAFCVTVV